MSVSTYEIINKLAYGRYFGIEKSKFHLTIVINTNGTPNFYGDDVVGRRSILQNAPKVYLIYLSLFDLFQFSFLLNLSDKMSRQFKLGFYAT